MSVGPRAGPWRGEGKRRKTRLGGSPRDIRTRSAGEPIADLQVRAYFRAGRGIAAFLMLTGIALFGVLTVNIAAFFVEQQQDDPVVAKLDEILRRLTTLEERNSMLD